MTAEITCEMQAARILLFVYMFYHVYLHYDQVICKSMKIWTSWDLDSWK